MMLKSKIKTIVKNGADSVKEDKYLKIALIILLFAFFLGYSMRVFDFTKSPILGEIGVI